MASEGHCVEFLKVALFALSFASSLNINGEWEEERALGTYLGSVR